MGTREANDISDVPCMLFSVSVPLCLIHTFRTENWI